MERRKQTIYRKGRGNFTGDPAHPSPHVL
ncbi:hypothetical protein CCACVL1_03793 [Corchorus capsularis]|uniref:Uncharacterized protein n=1 Tax=Corchorus capsularis TaxID=210143 RepID=A0A1R3JXP2_COCAP|nr:hypothetical protein CCACVL1_03793 [Corchorus capsularis]